MLTFWLPPPPPAHSTDAIHSLNPTHTQSYEARPTRGNNATLANVDYGVVFAQGAFMNVYKGVYIEGDRTGH